MQMASRVGNREASPDGQHPNQDTILLKNVASANLHANDFILPIG
jgi:hypothetical protein